MATGDKWVGCDNPSIGSKELLNAIAVKVTSTGVEGINTHITTIAHGSVSDAINCDMPNQDFEQWLRSKIVEDVEGKPAFHLIVKT